MPISQQCKIYNVRFWVVQVVILKLSIYHTHVVVNTLGLQVLLIFEIEILAHVCNLYILCTTDAGLGQLRSESQNVASRQHSLNSSYELLVKQAEVCG